MRKRTEKSKANSRQDNSRANGRQEKSIANGRQSKPKDNDRDKAKYEEKYITEESCSKPVQKRPRTDADAQQGQHELKLGEVSKTIPTIDFNVETVEYKNQSFIVQKDTEMIHREIKGGTNEDHLLLRGEPGFSEKRRLKDLVKKHSERQPYSSETETRRSTRRSTLQRKATASDADVK